MKDKKKIEEDEIGKDVERSKMLPDGIIKVSGRQVYLLYRGLSKYASYPGKEFALFVYRGIGRVSALALGIIELTAPLDDYYRIERDLREKYFKDDAVLIRLGIEEMSMRRDNEAVLLFLGEVEELRKRYKVFLDKEEETRLEVERLLGLEYEIEVGKISFSLLPKEFTAQDIEVFSPLIDYE